MKLAADTGHPLRLLYALGPGNVVLGYRHWKAGTDVLSETSRTYAGQFFDFCRRSRHNGYAISSFGAPEKLDDGPIVVENRPKRLIGTGIGYHRSQILYGISIMFTAVRWRADVAIVDSGTTHWALLAILRLARIRIVGCLHNTPWPAGYKPTGRAKRVILASERWFWRHVASALLSNSPECERQVRELAGDRTPVAVQYRAQFNRSDFASIPPPPALRLPFRVMFAGRLERNKGVFDIVEMAVILEQMLPGAVHFDICGDGPAREELQEAVNRLGHHGRVRMHGRLNRSDLLKVYAACHVVVVPTRNDFCEGLPKVCAEAILCARPVITSRLSNALDVLSGAVAIATPDEPQSYADAIRQTLEDPAFYERLRNACPPLQEQFYDSGFGLTAAFERVFTTSIV